MKPGTKIKFKPPSQLTEGTRNWARDYGWDLEGLRMIVREYVDDPHPIHERFMVAVTDYGKTVEKMREQAGVDRRIWVRPRDVVPAGSLFTVRKK